MEFPVTIHITKEILSKSMQCGTFNQLGAIEENCAIALAIRDIFPSARVTNDSIIPFSKDCEPYPFINRIVLPKIASDFIKVFDSLSSIPKLRLLLPEFDFHISVSEELISLIDLDEINSMIAIKEPA